MIRVLVFYMIMGFSVLVGWGQTAQIDSLAQLQKNAKGTELFQITNELAGLYLDYNPKLALDNIEEILSHESLEANSTQRGVGLFIKGRALTILGRYDDSYISFDEAMEIFSHLQDEENMAKTHLGRGIALAYHSKFEEAEEELTKSLQIFTDLDNESGMAHANYELGHLAYFLGEDGESLRFYNESLDLYRELDDKKGISNVHFRRGITYHAMNDEEKALADFVVSKELKEGIGDISGLSKVNISMGILHEEKGNFDTALGYYMESLRANNSIGDLRVSSVIFNNIGILYEDWKKYDSAVVYHNKSMEIRKSLGDDRGVTQSLTNIGEAYQRKKDLAQAVEFYRRAFVYSRDSEQQPMFAHLHDKLGQAFLESGRLDSADHYLNKALALRKSTDSYSALAGTYNNLARLHETKGDYQQALEYHKLFKQVQDSSFQTRASRELAEVQAKYDTERQKQEINTLQQENKNRTLWRNIFAVGTLVTLGFALMVFQFFMYRNKKNKELLASEEAQRQQLEELDQMKSRFFNNISHEFRTPLTLILGPLDKIRNQVDQSLHPTVSTIERNGKRLLKLINQLLDLSKLESGKMELKTSFLDLVPLLKGWVMSFHSIAETKGIALTLEGVDKQHFIYMDVEKMENVVINLVSNALKYTGEGGQVTIKLEELVQHQKEYLRLSVMDTGSGIPEPELEHIFDRFYQASNSETQDVTGTGIGLALIKELVELHTGWVDVDSTLGKGSMFHVWLPLGKDHLSSEQIVNRGAKESTISEAPIPLGMVEEIGQTSKQDGELPLALLIEDNEDLKAYIADILKDSYSIIQANDGKTGVAMAKEHVPDIIISDLMMPKMNGLEVCQELKNEMLTSHIPIILLTARSSQEDKIEGLKSLADDYLTKPFNTEELLVRLHNLIQIREKIRSNFASASMLTPKKLQLSSMDQVFMEKVTEKMEGEISNSDFGVVELASAVGLSRSQLFRKIKAITDLTPNEYMRSFRLHRAMDMLKQQSATVAEIAYDVGFQNASYFSKCFQEEFGMPPSAV